MDFVYKTRVTLINLGKLLPFVLCSLVAISYIENIYALYLENYLVVNDVVVLNKPISYFIGSYFEYNIQTLIVIVVVSYSIQTCCWNKLACLYLAINLYEKFYFANNEFETYVYYIVSVTNILVCVFLCYKGIRQITKSK